MVQEQDPSARRLGLARYQGMSVDELIAERERVSSSAFPRVRPHATRPGGVLVDPTDEQIAETRRIVDIIDGLILVQAQNELKALQAAAQAETRAEGERQQQRERDLTNIIQEKQQQATTKREQAGKQRVREQDQQLFDTMVEQISIYDKDISNRIRLEMTPMVTGVGGISPRPDTDAINSIIDDIKAGKEVEDISSEGKPAWMVEYMKSNRFRTAVNRVRAFDVDVPSEFDEAFPELEDGDIAPTPTVPPIDTTTTVSPIDTTTTAATTAAATTDTADEVDTTEQRMADQEEAANQSMAGEAARVTTGIIGDPPGLKEVTTWREAVREAAVRYIIAEHFDRPNSKNITKQDISDDREGKYEPAIQYYMSQIVSLMSVDHYADFLENAGSAGDQWKIAWLKAKIFVEANGSQYQTTDTEANAHLIRFWQTAIPEQDIELGYGGENIMASQPWQGTKIAIFRAFEMATPQQIGFDLPRKVDLQDQEVTRRIVLERVHSTAMDAGLNIHDVHVNEWAQATAENIYTQTVLALGPQTIWDILDDDRTQSWITLQAEINKLDKLTPEEIVTDGWKLLRTKSAEGWVSEFILQSSELKEVMPDITDRMAVAEVAFDELRFRFLNAAPMVVDPDTGEQIEQMMLPWVQQNHVQESIAILAKVNSIALGLADDDKREKWFYDKARATRWDGEKILSEEPSAFDRRVIHRAWLEADQTFIDRGEIPGTFVDIVESQFANWDVMLRKQTNIESTMPPGMEAYQPLDPKAAETAIWEQAQLSLQRLSEKIGPGRFLGDKRGLDDLKRETEAQVTRGQGRVADLQRQLMTVPFGGPRASDTLMSLSTTKIQRDLDEAQALLRDKERQLETYNMQSIERDKNVELFEVLQKDGQLAYAFASGNTDGLRKAAMDRNLDVEGIINPLITMQKSQGLVDRGAVRIATPETIEARAQEAEIAAARQKAKTRQYDAAGNLVEFDPNEDYFDVTSGKRFNRNLVDADGNLIAIEANPNEVIPGTTLPDTEENRRAVMGGQYAPDQQVQAVDTEGNPIPGEFVTRRITQSAVEAPARTPTYDAQGERTVYEQQGAIDPFVRTGSPPQKFLGWLPGEKAAADKVIADKAAAKAKADQEEADKKAAAEADKTADEKTEIGTMGTAAPKDGATVQTNGIAQGPAAGGPQWLEGAEPELPPMVQEQRDLDLVRNMPKKNNRNNRPKGK